MNNEKFTPGPWEIRFGIKTAINKNKKHIAMVNWLGVENEIEHNANVSLISMSPEIYWALKCIHEGKRPWNYEYIGELLKKARGEE